MSRRAADVRGSDGGSPRDGGPARDGGIHTGRAVVLLAVAALVAVVVLRHVGTTAVATTTARKLATTSTTIHRSGGTVAATTTTSTTVAALPPAQVKVLVLNGTLSGNLAGDASRSLKVSPGFATLAPDNTTSQVFMSNVYASSAAYLPSARAIAAVYGLPATDVSSPVPASAPITPAERPLADVVLVIGPDIAGKVAAG